MFERRRPDPQHNSDPSGLAFDREGRPALRRATDHAGRGVPPPSCPLRPRRDGRPSLAPRSIAAFLAPNSIEGARKARMLRGDVMTGTGNTPATEETMRRQPLPRHAARAQRQGSTQRTALAAGVRIKAPRSSKRKSKGSRRFPLDFLLPIGVHPCPICGQISAPALGSARAGKLPASPPLTPPHPSPPSPPHPQTPR